MYAQTPFDQINDNMNVKSGQIQKNVLKCYFRCELKHLVLWKL